MNQDQGYRDCSRAMLPVLWLAVACCIFPAVCPARDGNRSITRAGNVLKYLIPAYAFGDLYYHDDDDGLRQCGKATLATVASTGVLKVTINASRPNGGDHGFPSGHTSFAMAGASCLGIREGFNEAWWLYLGTAFVGYSRVQAREHTTGQVLAGAGLAYLSSLYFVSPRKDVVIAPMIGDTFAAALSYNAEGPENRLVLGPVISREGVGLGITYNY